MRTLVVGIVAAVAVRVAWAETVPPRGVVDSRVRSVIYNRDEVYRLNGAVGQEIHIEFQAGENFVALSGGDLDALIVGSERNSLSIKPRVAFVDSNFTIITTQRYYHVTYTAGARRRGTEERDQIFSLRFIYSPEERGARLLADRLLEEALAGETEDVKNTDYWYCGSPILKPIAASDNGVHTRLRFGEQTEWPAVFVREDDGSEAMVNFSVRGHELVIHEVARQFILRRGRLTGCVVNRGFAGNSASADSMTASPQVRRQFRGSGDE